jgi:small-conductance mechanosensitive channel
MKTADLDLSRLLSTPLAQKAMIVMAGLILIYILTRLLKKASEKYITQNDQLYRTKKGVNFLGYFLFLGLFLFTFSDRLGNVAVTLGVIGAGVTFALQEVIASIAGWFVILFTGTIKTGDRVQFGGIKGDVIDIGVIKTTIMEMGQWIDGELYNGRLVNVANSFVFKEPVFNYTADFPFVWDEIQLHLTHDSDIALARQLMQKTGENVTGAFVKESKKHWQAMIKKYRIEHANIAPMVTLQVNENALHFTLRYIVDSKKRRITKDQLFSQLFEQISTSNGAIEFSVNTLQIIK